MLPFFGLIVTFCAVALVPANSINSSMAKGTTCLLK